MHKGPPYNNLRNDSSTNAPQALTIPIKWNVQKYLTTKLLNCLTFPLDLTYGIQAINKTAELSTISRWKARWRIIVSPAHHKHKSDFCLIVGNMYSIQFTFERRFVGQWDFTHKKWSTIVSEWISLS